MSAIEGSINLPEVQQAWAAMISSVSWHHFAHLTFREEAPADVARRDFDRYVRFLERWAQGPVDWAVTVERTHRTHYHLHALLKNTRALPTRDLVNRWLPGHARVTIYRRHSGAEEYMTKAITRESCDVDVSGRLRAGPEGWKTT